MLITKETDYALRILRALSDEGRVTAVQLANEEQIPQQFAYKILKKLQKGGLIQILRGADGGCTLAAQLEQVSLFRLMQIMEEGRVTLDLLPLYFKRIPFPTVTNSLVDFFNQGVSVNAYSPI